MSAAKTRNKNVVILVLGDIGRSPRMQFHALSLADQAEMNVDIVGYAGSTPYLSLVQHPRIRQHHLAPFQWRARGAMLAVYYPLKVLHQLFTLLWTLLFVVRKPSFVLVQNPPAIPSLFVVHLVSWLRCSKLVIDWHNFGYSLMALSHGPKHPLVRVAYWYERLWGRGAYANFCVTKAMQQTLAGWGIRATVLYDRPPSHFRRLTVPEQHELFLRLHREGCLKDFSWNDANRGDEAKSAAKGASAAKQSAATSTLFTVQEGKECKLRADRPALLMSSTSWTEDENFDLLIQAAAICDQQLASGGGGGAGAKGKAKGAATPSASQPRLLFIITGKGPQKEHYEAKIAAQNAKTTHVRILTAWLAAEDYPRLLGSADLGVSLHLSSSGLDLPMKVVDMFGCGLPVCAVDFPCLDELVQHNKNGLVFKDERQLADHMMSLLGQFPSNTTKLAALRTEVAKFQSVRWTDSWGQHALPVFSA